MSPTGYCQYCRSVQPLGETWERGQPAFWCQRCDHLVAQPHAAGETLSAQPPLILCIDDDHLLLGLFSKALQRFGFRTLIASDAASGIEVASRERPALIVLDVMMLGLNGIEICRRLRADPALRDTPIILLTAREDPELDAQGREAGATLTVRKLLGLESIVETIAQVLNWNTGPGTS